MMYKYAFTLICTLLIGSFKEVNSNCILTVEPNSYSKEQLKHVKVKIENTGDGNAELINFALDFRTGDKVLSGESPIYPKKGDHLTVKPGQTIIVNLDLNKLHYTISARNPISTAQFLQQLKSGKNFKMRSRAVDLTKLKQGIQKFFIFSNVVTLN